jgi:ElaB/YqjD/DUF883 family membrane-anchored ribosome-binding protein
MNKNGTIDSTDDKSDSIKDTVQGIVDQGAQKVDAVKAKVVDIKDQAFTRGEDLVERVTDMVKANPLKAIGIAFGAGYIGMRLFRR